MNSIQEIAKAIHKLKTDKEICNFLLEILTETEVETLSKRWQILELLNAGMTQREISKELNVSLCKVTRGSKILKNKKSTIAKNL
ncbi:MAG: trp operon repressor [bacterium]|nr:trp operon repressor [bacterium]